MKNKDVFLHSITTCVPETVFSQDFIYNFLLKLQGKTESRRIFLTKLYKNTTIAKRHTVIDDLGKNYKYFNFFPKNPSLKPEPLPVQRNELFIKEANRLSLKVVQKLLANNPDFDKNKITDLITVSCTGFSAPGFDFHIAKNFQLSPFVNRFHIGFMGCYASFPAMKLAQSICLANHEARVLIVNVELCTLHFQQKFDPEIVVANAIFSDGVSATLVSCDKNDTKGNKMIMHNFLSRYYSDGETDMVWKLGKTGFDLRLSLHVPKIIRQNIKRIMEELFQQSGISQQEISLWAVHPGGKTILEEIQTALHLSKDHFRVSYDILKEYGNMSSSTIMFVLEKILNNNVYGKIFSCAFGPGLTIETGYLEKVS